jgi:hypothetical protein
LMTMMTTKLAGWRAASWQAGLQACRPADSWVPGSVGGLRVPLVIRLSPFGTVGFPFRPCWLPLGAPGLLLGLSWWPSEGRRVPSVICWSPFGIPWSPFGLPWSPFGLLLVSLGLLLGHLDVTLRDHVQRHFTVTHLSWTLTSKNHMI